MSQNPVPCPAELDRTNVTRAEAAARSALLTVHSYEVDVDVRGATDPARTGYPVTTTVRFDCAQPGASTHLDYIAESVDAVELNGRTLDVAAVAGDARIRLDDLEASNTVVVRGTSAYSRSGEGMHRFVDPADGQTYLYTQYEPADARRVFPTFEQPDLKGHFVFALSGPADWVLASNRPESAREDLGDGHVRVRFEPTLPQSTYITTLLAGPYAQWEDRWGGHGASGADAVDLRLFTRATMAEHFDPERVFAVTKAGLDHFHDLFGVPYEWGKYDQAFVPEYNLGAMENPGLVTFTEDFVFTSRATAVQYEGRANVILHEMAHMWFGDLVTMSWWDDLWLKESFADYMGSLGVDEATEFSSSWVTFASRRKAWAYVQDQLPTTHPIVADIVDLEAARQNFDGITYAKGASVLKQLAAFVGREAFLDAARRYFQRHAWGNAALADFMAALAEASGRDMDAWAQAWLHTAGVPRLSVEVGAPSRQGRPATPELVHEATDPVTGEQVLRPHVLKVGVFEPSATGALVRTGQTAVEVPAGQARTPLTELEVPADGVRLVLPNDEDLTYAKLTLDDASLDAVLTHPVADPLAQATVWAALWSMVRDGDLSVRAFIQAVGRLGASLREPGVYQMVMTQAASAIGLYARVEDRAQLRTELAAVLAGHLEQLEPGGDRQRAAARVLAQLGRDDADVARLAARTLVTDAESRAPQLQVDREIRWLVLQARASTGLADADELDAELERDRTAQTVLWHTVAVNSLPAESVARAAWQAVMSGADASGTALSNDLLSATAEGFGTADRAVKDALLPEFWPQLEHVWASRSNGLASRTILGLFPVHQDALDGGEDAQQAHPALAAAQGWLDEHPDAPGALRRVMIEQTDALRRALRVQSRQRSLEH